MYTIPLVGPMVNVQKFSRPHFNKFYNDDVDCIVNRLPNVDDDIYCMV